MRKITLTQAQRDYPNRYTMEHVPAWARKACEGNGKFYAPQYATDKEWYDNTIFPREGPEAEHDHCYSSNATFPLGEWLDKPYSRRSAA